MATQADITFPILGFRKNGEVVTCFNAKDMCKVSLEDVDSGEIVGTEITDGGGAAWRVAKIHLVKAGWFAMRSTVSYDLEPIPLRPLGEIKDKVCAALEAEPEAWTDADDVKDDPAKLIRRETRKIRAARSIAEICDYFGPYWF